jgi:hypothetical protein
VSPRKRRPRLDAGFDNYRRVVMPKGTTPEVVAVCRDAYFAGALAVLSTVRLFLDDASLPADVFAADIAAMRAETDAFITRVQTREKR